MHKLKLLVLPDSKHRHLSNGYQTRHRILSP